MARLAGVRAEEYSWRIKEAYAHEERMAEIKPELRFLLS